jgi:hypothetical protein
MGNLQGRRTAKSARRPPGALIEKTGRESKENIGILGDPAATSGRLVASLLDEKARCDYDFDLTSWSFEPAGLQPR